MNNKKISIGEAATISGLSIRTLQYYDDIGLFRASGRLENGRRYYHEASLIELEQIVFYTKLGFSLKKTKELIGESKCRDVSLILEKQELLLISKSERIQILIAATEVCKEITAAHFVPPWALLTSLITSMSEIDLLYWRDFPYTEEVKKKLTDVFPSFEEAMGFCHELNMLLLKASTYEAAHIPTAHDLARKLADEWTRFLEKRIGEDKELVSIFRMIAENHARGYAMRCQNAEKYLEKICEKQNGVADS